MKLWYTLGLALVVVGAALWLGRREVAPPPVATSDLNEPAPVATGTVTPSNSLPAPKLREFQMAPRVPIAAPPQDQVSKACQDFFDQLRSFDLSRITITSDLSFPPSKECKEVPQALRGVHDEYVKKCFTKKPKEVTHCFMAANTYRVSLTDWLTRNVALKTITDPKVLADKLTARLMTNPASASEVAERLLEIEPNLPLVNKAAALTRFIDASTKGAKNPQDPSWSKADDAIASAKRANPEDLSLLEMELVSGMLRQQDPRTLRNQVEAQRETNPEMADYLLSWMDYNSGNAGAALERLRAMQSRGSKDPRLANTITNIQQKKKEAFQMTVTIPGDLISPPLPAN